MAAFRKLTRGTVHTRLDFLDHLVRRDGNPALMRILSGAFRDPSPAVRGKAAQLVQDRGLRGAEPLIHRLLTDRSSEVRRDAAECIGNFQKNSNSSQLGLRCLLSDKNAVVRAEAAESLAIIGDRSALPTIARLLSDKVPFVRSYAASAIGDLKGFAYLPKLRTALQKEKNELARVGLLGGLIALGKTEVFSQLLELLKSNNYRVRCAVANTLEFLPMNSKETKLAVAALSTVNRRPIVRADRSTIKRVLKSLKAAA